MTSRTIHFVSLGCPKNRVDSERMVALAAKQGLVAVADPAAAEVILVNTCGFIEAAKQESIDALLEMAAFKQPAQGRCRQLIAAGCLAQRYAAELAAELPEVDHFIGTADLPRLATILDDAALQAAPRLAVGAPVGLAEASYERALTGPAHVAYLKISEGCNRPCAFCSIPLMRGQQRSRTVASLLDEARSLADRGTRELILVAQDTTAYGHDLAGAERAGLTDLLAALDREADPRIVWIRLLYAYPSLVDARLAQALADARRVVPYVDLPIQHVDDALLSRMRRGYGERQLWRAIDSLRATLPEVVLRSTVLVGHPGETDAAHRALCDFLRRAELDHVGAFAYSAEEGTDAASQPDPVPPELAAERVAEVMQLQQQLSRRKLTRLHGQRLEVLVDGPSSESDYLLQGRHRGQAPEIDGVVVLTDGEAHPGELRSARVVDSGDYDLVATLELEV